MNTVVAFVTLLLASTGIANCQQDIPTLVPPTSFDPIADAGRLYDALAGIGTDENKIISVLCYRVFSQRAEITDEYNTNYGDLLRDLRGDLSGDFLTLSEMLTYDLSNFLAIEFHSAMAGVGFDEPSMTEILISRSNQELKNMGIAYYEIHGKTVVQAITGEVTGSLRDLYILLAEGSRDEGVTVDSSLVDQDVKALYDAGAGNAATDESVFVNIFASRNWLHLREVSKRYDAAYGSLEAVITTEFDAKTGNALVAILHYSKNKADYFAVRFHESIIGFGTADRDLKRLTVSRCETDLENIKTAYEKLYLRTLSSAVEGDTTGAYQTALLALIG